MNLRGNCCTVIGHMQYANGREIRENVNTQLEKMNIKLFDHYKQPFIMDETKMKKLTMNFVWHLKTESMIK